MNIGIPFLKLNGARQKVKFTPWLYNFHQILYNLKKTFQNKWRRLAHMHSLMLIELKSVIQNMAKPHVYAFLSLKWSSFYLDVRVKDICSCGPIAVIDKHFIHSLVPNATYGKQKLLTVSDYFCWNNWRWWYDTTLAAIKNVDIAKITYIYITNN